MSNKRLPIEAYPSEYMDFLRKAALSRVEVHIPNVHVEGRLVKTGAKRAVNIVARINTLRSVMKQEKHPLYEAVAKASVTRRVNPDETGTIVGQPRDADVLGAFHAAGFKPETLEHDPLAQVNFDDTAGLPEVEES